MDLYVDKDNNGTQVWELCVYDILLSYAWYVWMICYLYMFCFVHPKIINLIEGKIRFTRIYVPSKCVIHQKELFLQVYEN